MLVSHAYKFIIINIPKTACTSIINSLIKNIYIDIVGDKISYRYYQHEKASTAREKLAIDGFDWNDYTSYARVRNPWSRYISYLLWAKKNKEKFPGIQRVFQENNYNNHAVLKYCIEHIETQHSYFLDKDEPIVQQIQLFENLHDDFDKFCKKYNLPEFKLLHSNKSSSYSYRDFYNQELIDLVAEKEFYIIDKYGYQY